MGVIYYSSPAPDFGDLYIAVRKLEQRFYTESQVRKLPDIEKNHARAKEWAARKISARRFAKYLENKNRPLKILDVGCGNGWFSHLLSSIGNAQVMGIDINVAELEQADKLFKKGNLSFAYADLYQNPLAGEKFDIIVFNSCLQYFRHLHPLFEVVSQLLGKDGEIHILDTPFYAIDNLAKARQRTEDYYTALGFPEMAAHYFHHSLLHIGKHQMMHKPMPIFLRRFKKDSPFCWIKLQADTI